MVGSNYGRLKKVAAWRLCSIVITLLTIWCIRGDIEEATFVTLFLHIILAFFHWSFECLWGRWVES